MHMQQRSFSRLFVAIVSLWCVGFMFGPALELSLAGTQSSSLIYEGICHQDPARSFSWFGAQWAVCHRCSAIYLAFAVGVFAAVLSGRVSLTTLPRPLVIALLLLPIIVDGTADLVGLRSSDLMSRLLTGGLTGAVLAMVVVPVLHDALPKLMRADVSPFPGGHDA